MSMQDEAVVSAEEVEEKEVSIVAVEPLFRRFWRQWHTRRRLAVAGPDRIDLVG